MIQMFSGADSLCLKLCRSKSRDFFELSRKMGDTAVTQFVSNLAKAQFIVNEEFLHLFNLLQDHKLLYCDAFGFREEFAET